MIVAIWEFLCIIMIATYCAARWTDKVVVYAEELLLVVTRATEELLGGRDYIY